MININQQEILETIRMILEIMDSLYGDRKERK